MCFSGNERNGLVWIDKQWLSRFKLIRRLIIFYFRPNPIECYRNGLIYKILGVPVIAYIVPTGGLLWRRLFHWKGWSFAMVGPSVTAAREYRYSTCVFEILHLVPFMMMLKPGLWAIQVGYTDGILKFLLAGCLMNGYMILLQRYNRVRINLLLSKIESRKEPKKYV